MRMQKVKRLFWFTSLAALVLFFSGGTASAAVKLVKGQTVYIPSYANVISGPPIYMTVPLRANLVIHNTDPSQAITVARIDEYDTEGQKVSSYLTAPVSPQSHGSYAGGGEGVQERSGGFGG